MKKILLLIAAVGLLMGTISCGDDDDVRPVRTETTVTYPMFNHITSGNNIIGITLTQNKLVFDTAKHTGTLELNYNDGTERTVSLKDISAKPKRLGFYELTASPTAQITGFKGYADFNELAFRYDYTTAEGIRVISMTPEVFFLSTSTSVTYDDNTKPSKSDITNYQFDISPATMTATITVKQIVHEKDLKNFNYIKAENVPIVLTANGFSINGTNIKTTAEYISFDYTTGSNAKTTNDYPFKTFNANIDLVNDKLDADFMLGGSATVTATGTAYSNYSIK